MSKYLLLKDQLLAKGILAADDILQPEPLRRRNPGARAHARVLGQARLCGAFRGEATAARPALVRGTLAKIASCLGRDLLAGRTALDQGLGGNLAGGTHHAFADHAEGFCVLNDVAIAIRKLHAERLIERAAIIDLDDPSGQWHTAAIFEADDGGVYFPRCTGAELSAGEDAFRFGRAPGRRAWGDAEYLDALQRHLPMVLDTANADIVFYLAGVDVAAGDRYGKLALTEEGIRQRDRWVIETVRSRGAPLSIVLAGGYAATRARTAELHAHAFREAVAYELRSESPAADTHRPAATAAQSSGTEHP